MNEELGKLLEEIDKQVRISAIKAHEEAVKCCAKIESLTIGDFEIPAKALIPRDLLAPKRMAMEFSVYATDKGVSLTKGLCRTGTKVDVAIEWEAKEAPEATSLVRTHAEATVADRPYEPYESKT